MSGAPVPHDARKQPRAFIELPVLVNDPANRTGGIQFESAEVSIGGAFLRSDLLLEVGDLLTLQFQLPETEGGRRSVSAVKTLGRVTRVSRGESREIPGMGVEFVELRPEDRVAIEERLQR